MKLPASYYNPVSLVGSIIAGISLLIIVFFLIAMSFFGVGGSYLGLFIYIVLPVFLILGLLLIPIGMIRRAKRLKKEGDENVSRGIKLDLNNKKHWNAVAIFLAVTFLFLLLTGVGSYEAFHYTESTEFCGTLCHKVMEPEYAAYQNSPHARVTCVECHVGPGADWYVKSKLSGLYQVYAVLTKVYPQPIPTPIESLRPARETCEQCHWPQNFYSHRLHKEQHFLADSANTEWNIQLKMKVGSEDINRGLLEGIHWHINKDVKIEYIASTEDREFIPWVRYVNHATGDTILYNDIYESLDQAAIDTLEVREMDCIDCHNRPSHHFLPPQEFTDLLIGSGKIPSELPEVKSLAMQIYSQNFDHRDTANEVIKNSVIEFYSLNYPDLVQNSRTMVNQAIEGLQLGYSRNFFPEMKASWDVYPNHIGHVEFNGCFRCHNGNHENMDGGVISRDCNLCHNILGQGTPDNYETTGINQALEFRHPVDIGESWKDYACSECHRYLY